MSAASAAQSPERRLSVRLARHAEDLAAVQHLRWQVFMGELGAASDGALGQLDRDPFDDLCDHLLVSDLDPTSGAETVVGTYRLLRGKVARRHGGFYSAREFDLTRLKRHAKRSGDLLELGRSCVLPAYRTSHTISLLWRGIAEYLSLHTIGAMFGCASFHGTDPDEHAASLSYLAHHCLAPTDQRPGVLSGRGIALERLQPGAYDERAALFGLPPLIKGYLRAGARFGDGAFVDHEFRTIDVCVVLPIERLAGRYASRFNVAA
ncbi:MAG TPA: GNAT family N-acyltransferase [Novosphingobium sp.]